MTTLIENLGLNPTYLTKKIKDGMQVMALNCYPPCPDPRMALGFPPHSDYSCLTIVHQSCPGLEIMDLEDGTWKVVPHLPGALQVHVGDHFEVLSNGLYKSVVHRATLNRDRTRISIASLFSLGMDDNMETAKELVDDEHPQKYRESSLWRPLGILLMLLCFLGTTSWLGLVYLELVINLDYFLVISSMFLMLASFFSMKLRLTYLTDRLMVE